MIKVIDVHRCLLDIHIHQHHAFEQILFPTSSHRNSRDGSRRTWRPMKTWTRSRLTHEGPFCESMRPEKNIKQEVIALSCIQIISLCAHVDYKDVSISRSQKIYDMHTLHDALTNWGDTKEKLSPISLRQSASCQSNFNQPEIGSTQQSMVTQLNSWLFHGGLSLISYQAN